MISIILNTVPVSIISSFGSLLFIVIFIATYVYKSKAPEDSLIHNHMRFIIKSIWVSSLILLVGMIASYLLADHTIIHQTYNTIMSGTYLTQEQIHGLIMDYMKANLFVFILTLTPCLIYLLYRLSKGILHARKGYIIPDLKSWM